MSINGKRTEILKEDLIKIGNDNMIKKSKLIIEEVISVISLWPEKAKEYDIDKRRIKKIESNLKLGLQ